MITDHYIKFTLPIRKSIALIAHDGKKAELIEWAMKNKDILKNHDLCGTGTSARLVSEKTGLPVRGFNSGPLGGDQQIGARITEGKINFVIFLCDPLESQPHDPDVKALTRICNVYDIPIAGNISTADFLLSSKFMTEEYEHSVTNYNVNIAERLDSFK